MDRAQADAIVRLEAVQKNFQQGRQWVPVLRQVSLGVGVGEIVALVGESGSGKSTIARMIMRLYAPDAGNLLFHGKDVSRAHGHLLKRYRSAVQMVFQDPFASLNPAHSVATILKRTTAAFGHQHHASQITLDDALERVGLTPPENFLKKYPHELSGGQRQRVAFARALANHPELLIADEPVSMLDVSLRLGILNLMLDLNETFRMGILYITHDLASARYVATRVIVLYAGQIVEEGPATTMVEDPQHPYTQILVKSAPDPDRRNEGAHALLVPRFSDPVIQGCAFYARCPSAMDRCRVTDPPTIPIDAHRSVKCFLFEPQ